MCIEKIINNKEKKGSEWESMTTDLKKAFAETLDIRMTAIEEKLESLIDAKVENKLKEEVLRREKEMEEIRQRIGKIEKEIKNTQKGEENESIPKELHGQYKEAENTGRTILRSQVYNEIKEIQERQERRKNIIIVGLGEEIQMNSIAEGENWLKENLELEAELNLVDCYRLGKEGNRCRLVKINFKTEQQQNMVYHKRKLLFNNGNGKFKNVYINGDKTKLQREQQREWRIKNRKSEAENVKDQENDKPLGATNEKTVNREVENKDQRTEEESLE